MAIKYLSTDQVRQLLAFYPDAQRRLLIRLLYYSGARISEVLALTPRDILREDRVVILPNLKARSLSKSQNVQDNKRVVLDSVTLELLEGYIRTNRIARNEKVFPFSRITAWQYIKDAGTALGFGWIHPHTLRHTFASHWAATASSDGDIIRLSRQLGHTKVSTTQDMYIHLATKTIQESYDKVFGKGDTDAKD